MRKMLLNTFLDLEFKLIGINASLEPYKMAFLINKNLKMQFKRTPKDVEMFHDNLIINFSLYSFCDPKTATKMYFIQNKSKYINQKPKFATSLFKDEDQIIDKHLIKSRLQSDYLIKIEDEFDRFKIKKLLLDLNEIPQIISAYEISLDHVKSPENLIFE